MTDVGISGGLSIDHVVTAPTGARFDQLGGPGLYAALGASLVAGSRVRLHTALPRSTPAFTRTLRAAGVDLTSCSEVPEVPRLWILHSAQGRRIVPTTPPPGLELDGPGGGVGTIRRPCAELRIHNLGTSGTPLQEVRSTLAARRVWAKAGVDRGSAVCRCALVPATRLAPSAAYRPGPPSWSNRTPAGAVTR